jgi:hypothetical protein
MKVWGWLPGPNIDANGWDFAVRDGVDHHCSMFDDALVKKRLGLGMMAYPLFILLSHHKSSNIMKK